MLLYHYTDVNGLIGILQNKSIWASQLRQMNDKKEGLIAKELLEIYFKSDYLREKFDEQLGIIMVGSFCSAILENFELSNTFVFSLSEEPDLLSQWRGYTPNGGYCIGFEKSAIEALATKNEFAFGPCCYEHDENMELIRSTLDNYLLNDIDWSRIDMSLVGTPNAGVMVDAASDIGSEVWEKFEGKAALMKDVSFKEEAEWRVYGLLSKPADVKFRAGGPYVRPYYELELDAILEEFQGEIIKEIIISPGLDGQKATSPLKQLVKNSNLGDIEIKHSRSPFRL